MGWAVGILTKSPSVVLGLLRFGDLVVVVIAGIAAYDLRHDTVSLPGTYISALLLGAALTANVFHVARLYQFDRLDHIGPQIPRLVMAWMVVASLLIAAAFFTKISAEFSRIWAAIWLGCSFAGFLIERIVLKFALAYWRRRGLLTRHAVIVGAGDHARRLIRHIRSHSEIGVDVFGLFDDRKTRIPRQIDGIEVVGTIDDLLMFVRSTDIDVIIIALPWQAEGRLAEIMAKLRTVPIDVQLAPDWIGFRLFDRRLNHLGGLPMLTVFEKPLTGWNYIVKAIEDRVLATLMLVVFAPLMVLIALAIRLGSAGPVLFRQHRAGFNNNHFTVYKFRTMRSESEADAAVVQARRDDDRITPIGAILRRTSLDELPQLFNVLKGEMSLVGPRPHAIAHNQEYEAVIDQYLGRHKVKPGITGWAQVHGLRGETDTPEKMEQRVQHDLYYIDNWSLLMDLRILVMTLFVGFVHQNAY